MDGRRVLCSSDDDGDNDDDGHSGDNDGDDGGQVDEEQRIESKSKMLVWQVKVINQTKSIAI